MNFPSPSAARPAIGSFHATTPRRTTASARLSAGLAACAAVLALVVAGCAEIKPQASSERDLGPLVYPAPPDQPRFYFERTIMSSADVIADNEDDAWRRALTGESRAGFFMSKPYGIAVNRGRLFVTDTAERQVKVFDIPEGRYFTIGEEDPGQLAKPIGIDTDEAGNVYVADASTRTIQIYDRDGNHLRAIKGDDMFDRLASVTVSADGSLLYVVDIGGVSSQNHRVRVFDSMTGELRQDIGKRGNGPGEFNLPRDLAIGKDGKLYVVDGGNFRVQIFDNGGQFIDSFGAAGRQLGNFSRPKEVAVDPDGNVYVVDTAFGNFQIFNPEGELLMFIGQRSDSPGPGRYMLPSGIAIDLDGRVYFVDQWFRKIDVFRPAALKEGEGYTDAPLDTAAK
ncbi:MAG: 6-bladed beta-propeller [Rhodocyclaceae bacterium]|nr:6-bladed beta-propeller [Rhodocyclaceae bacterium]